MTLIAALPDRTVLAVTGGDRVKFVNGLVSNDIKLVAPGVAVWAALLTPQGKWVADFFVFADGDRLLLDCAADRVEAIVSRLTCFRLRADVAFEKLDWHVYVAWNGPPDVAGAAVVLAPDPRIEAAGTRILTGSPLASNADAQAWDLHRIRLALPDGARDMEAEKSILLEAGFDELHGISWTKGCYMGQELTARTRYRGLIKRRLLPVRAEAGLPASGTPIFDGAKEVGTLRSAHGEDGLALMRLDALAAPLTCAGAAIQVRVPEWARLEAK